MKIGVVADIHGNLPALEAVLSDMPPVEKRICLGDIVGYNPFPAECVAVVQDAFEFVIQGNHDREVKNAERYSSNHQAEAGLEYAEKELEDDQIEYLLTLPTEVEVEELLAVHSHPVHRDEYVFPRDFPTMRPYLDDYGGILLGHTHIQHKAVIDDRLILNPGSVGQPRDGTHAAYAVVDTDSMDGELHSTEYDVEKTIQEIHRVGLPEATAERLTPGSDSGRGRSKNPWR